GMLRTASPPTTAGLLPTPAHPDPSAPVPATHANPQTAPVSFRSPRFAELHPPVHRRYRFPTNVIPRHLRPVPAPARPAIPRAASSPAPDPVPGCAKAAARMAHSAPLPELPSTPAVPRAAPATPNPPPSSASRWRSPHRSPSSPDLPSLASEFQIASAFAS